MSILDHKSTRYTEKRERNIKQKYVAETSKEEKDKTHKRTREGGRRREGEKDETKTRKKGRERKRKREREKAQKENRNKRRSRTE